MVSGEFWSIDKENSNCVTGGYRKRRRREVWKELLFSVPAIVVLT